MCYRARRWIPRPLELAPRLIQLHHQTRPARRRIGDFDIASNVTRSLSTSAPRLAQDPYEAKAQRLSQKGIDEEEKEVKARQKQIRRPWLRENADQPPVSQTTDKPEPLTEGMLFQKIFHPLNSHQVALLQC